MYTDFRRYRIPNVILAIVLILGVIYHLMQGFEGLLMGILSMCIPFFILFPFFCLRALGAGDIKLLCVLSFYMAPKEAFLFMAVSFLIGAVISILKMIFEHNFKDRFKTFLSYLTRCFLCRSIFRYEEEWKGLENQKKRVIHFSLPIAISTFLWLGGIL